MKRNNKKIFWILYYTVCSFCLCFRTVQAYVDPSVMTYAIQAIAGIAITLGTVAGVSGRKILKLFDGKKQDTILRYSEDNLEFCDPTTGETHKALSFLSEQEKERLIQAEQSQKKKTDNRFLSGILLTAAISFMWMFYAPLQLFINNLSEFKFDFLAILPALLLMLSAGLVTGLLVYGLCYKLSRHLYAGLVIFGVIFLIATYIQGNVLISDLPALDGTRFNWAGYSAQRVQSLVLWAVVTVLVFVLYIKLRSTRFFRTVNYISFILLLTLFSTLIVNGFRNNAFTKRESPIVSRTDEFTYSSGQNFIILMLDAADSGTFRRMMETEEPEYEKIFEDFTYYPNTVGCYTYTRHAVPYILTGKWMENQKPYVEFETEAMDESPLFRMLEEKNYRMGLYETELTYDNDHIFRFENIKNGRYSLDSIGEFARQNFYAVWFQYMPYQLKPLLSHEDMISNIQNRAVGSVDAFVYDDSVFYNNVLEEDFNVTDQNCFRFIHLDGAHVPFRYDKDVNVIPIEQGSYGQNMQASMTLTAAYLQKLKDYGVYDNSVIIVMADHGYSEENVLFGRANPLLLVKGIQESHPMVISEQPVSYEDLQEVYRKLCDGESSNNLISYGEQETRSRRFLIYDYNDETVIRECVQDGYASDFDHMRETGNVYRLSK